MSTKKTPASLIAFAAFFALSLAVSAQAGSFTVPPGTTAPIDVAARDGYTTITVSNTAATAGSLQLPAGGAVVSVPANGKVELYDRYGRGTPGAAYVTLSNTGSVPLQVISRYQATYMTQ